MTLCPEIDKSDLAEPCIQQQSRQLNDAIAVAEDKLAQIWGSRRNIDAVIWIVFVCASQNCHDLVSTLYVL
jgi:hypothetical protein